MKHRFSTVIFRIILFTFISGAAQAAVFNDHMGRKVRVPDHPQRIVTLTPGLTEVIFILGQAHRLKGVTRYSDFPPEAAKLPQVGSYIRPELEKILALRPDICFATKDGNPRIIVSNLEALGIPVYITQPTNLKTVMETIQEIGDILGAEERAEKVVADMRNRIAAVRRRADALDSRPGVFFQIGISPIVSVGTDTFIHELIILAGGRNLAAGPEPYPRFSREQVLGFSPDVLIITSMSRAKGFEKVKAEWSRWKNMPAARNGKLHVVDSDLFDRPTPRLVDALEILFSLIH
ncbi:cobalamin-binding protein [Desulfonema ishimotonii]|uniref:Cobalamin-binding protein n=1 Tax=Desulfonema ishimotonii TaxID=45657 RepID=A0A401FUR0_9BACT|nr:cobalamin-binding protein [Desulfonema ishimotonii]GBC60693.1 cobalamin-binding protein [Desulfonema ishimotonii]